MSSYEYEALGDLVFVKELPHREVAFRDDPDGRGKTWSELSIDAQIKTFGDYFALAQEVAGWSGNDLKAGFRLARRIMSRIDLDPKKESISNLLFGQRIANGMAKVAFSRARERRESNYFRVGPCPYPHLEPWDLYSDRVFAHLRLAGMNPVLVQTVETLQEVGECADLEEVAAQFEHDELGDVEQAVEEGRITVLGPGAYAPLAVLRHAVEPEHPHQRRFFCQPTAVFVRPTGESYLRPIAIRCHRDFATIRPIHGQIWERAKLHVQVADSLYQTFVSHLPQTHFMMEAVALVTRRTLGFDERGADHPVRRLLEPHLEGTMAVNRVARKTLTDGSSSFLEFVGADVHSTNQLLSNSFKDRAKVFETSFTAHRVEHVDGGLVYPYRDDFAKLQPIVRSWVDQFIQAHYAGGNAQVQGDEALQSWVTELRHFQHGRLRGVGDVQTVARLVDVLDTIVSLATLQHAAFHFPQTDLGRLSYVTPFYASDVPPGQSMDEEAELTRLQSLPDLHAAAWQSFVLGQSDLRWGTLRDLPSRFEGREQTWARRMWGQLEAVEAELVVRDAQLIRDGLTPYPYLHPSMVPCSINT